MKKTTKGALAAGAAAALLIGGAGTLAFWSDDAEVDGGEIEAGSIDFSEVECGDDWLEGGAPVAVLVPGDTVTKECTGTLTLVGDHIGATVALDAASVADAEAAFNDEIVITAALSAPDEAIEGPGSYPVTVAITVAFDGPGATNASQESMAALDALELTAEQTHVTP